MSAFQPANVLLPLIAGFAMLASSPAHAQRQPERAAERQVEDSRSTRARATERRQDSMAESIRHVRRSNRGSIIAADRMHSNGRQINRIKLVDDRGRVRVIEDDPQRRRAQRSRGDDD